MLVDGKITNDQSSILSAWSDHFKNVHASHAEEFPILEGLMDQLEDQSIVTHGKILYPKVLSTLKML